MAVALFAIGLSCLLSASSPWAGLAFSTLMITLTLAPLIAVYRLAWIPTEGKLANRLA
jgi:hypothetical protein